MAAGRLQSGASRCASILEQHIPVFAIRGVLRAEEASLSATEDRSQVMTRLCADARFSLSHARKQANLMLIGRAILGGRKDTASAVSKAPAGEPSADQADLFHLLPRPRSHRCAAGERCGTPGTR
jgi:hypothetical protein